MVTPDELIAGKVRAYHERRGQPKSFTDLRDLALLFLTFPELKAETGPVRERLEHDGADPPVLATWRELAAQQFLPGVDE